MASGLVLILSLFRVGVVLKRRDFSKPPTFRISDLRREDWAFQAEALSVNLSYSRTGSFRVSRRGLRACPYSLRSG